MKIPCTPQPLYNTIVGIKKIPFLLSHLRYNESKCIVLSQNWSLMAIWGQAMTCFIQNSVITNLVIKRLRCTLFPVCVFYTNLIHIVRKTFFIPSLTTKTRGTT